MPAGRHATGIGEKHANRGHESTFCPQEIQARVFVITQPFQLLAQLLDYSFNDVVDLHTVIHDLPFIYVAVALLSDCTTFGSTFQVTSTALVEDVALIRS